MLLNKNNINLLIDFDSTFIRLESLDVISQLSLQKDKNKILEMIKLYSGKKITVSPIPILF